MDKSLFTATDNNEVAIRQAADTGRYTELYQH